MKNQITLVKLGFLGFHSGQEPYLHSFFVFTEFVFEQKLTNGYVSFTIRPFAKQGYALAKNGTRLGVEVSTG